MKRNVNWRLLVVAASCWPVAAFAYIDPGTGSILIQGLIAAIAAIGVTLKLYWHRFVGLFRRKSDGRSGVERSAARSVEREESSHPSSRREQLRQ